MKALILNSGLGSRMGDITKEHPKCMTEISDTDTILSRQLRQLSARGINEIVITTGYYDQILTDYCLSLGLPVHFSFVKNPIYDKTNYIYSIFCATDDLKDEDIILMHGDLVFEDNVLDAIVGSNESCMVVSSTLPLPEKDFKAVIHNGQVEKVAIDVFTDALAAQPLYKLLRKDWNIWLDNIANFCNAENRKCYAENAFNEVSDRCIIKPVDVKDMLCAEIDTPEDHQIVMSKLVKVKQ